MFWLTCWSAAGISCTFFLSENVGSMSFGVMCVKCQSQFTQSIMGRRRTLDITHFYFKKNDHVSASLKQQVTAVHSTCGEKQRVPVMGKGKARCRAQGSFHLHMKKSNVSNVFVEGFCLLLGLFGQHVDCCWQSASSPELDTVLFNWVSSDTLNGGCKSHDSAWTSETHITFQNNTFAYIT